MTKVISQATRSQTTLVLSLRSRKLTRPLAENKAVSTPRTRTLTFKFEPAGVRNRLIRRYVNEETGCERFVKIERQKPTKLY